MTNFAKNAHTKAPMALLACTLALVLFGCNAGQPDVSSTPVGAAPTATSVAGGTGSQGDFIQIDPSANISGNDSAVPVGQTAPDFTLPGIDGKTYTLSALKGKAVVLEFIATWCPHCQADAPTFNKLYNAYHSKGVEIIDINATPRGHDNKSPATTNDLLWFRDTYKVEFPMLFDKTLKSSADYGILSYPSVYIVDKNDKVAYQPPTDHVPSYDEITGVLDGLLK
jgi:cytochrome c biogenesis protein CcmG, thiol:disulfide interchange protein DsbE